MASGDTQQTTVSSAPANPEVTNTANKILAGVNTQLDTNPADSVFGQPLYAGVGDTTRQAWNSATSAANNPAFTGAVGTATDFAGGLLRGGGLTSGQSGDVATMRDIGLGYGLLGQNGGLNATQTGALGTVNTVGQGYGNLYDAFAQDAPGYQAVRDKVSNDALTSVNGLFNNSGRFGGGTHVVKAAEGVGNVLAGLDYQNFQNDVANRYNSLGGQLNAANTAFGMGQTGVGNQFSALAGQAGQANSAFSAGQTGVGNAFTAGAALPGLYQASMLPSQTMAGIGAAQDADAQARLLAQNDLFRRQQDARMGQIGWGAGVLAGPSAAGGTVQTTTEPATPWWQSALGLGIGAAGAFL